MAKEKKNKLLITEEFKQYLLQHYVNGDKSVPIIAEEFQTYPNRVYRAMQKLGIPKKDRSEAQRRTLESGRSPHPTKGKKHPAIVKRRIGRSVFQKNRQLTPEQRKARVDKIRDRWYSLPETTRQEYLKKSHESIRRAGREGSVFERYVVAALLGAKYKLETHYTLSFAGSKQNVDIFLPGEGIVIEIDGPVHFEPIFGQDALDEQIRRDVTKNQLLISEGYSVIRIQNPKGYTSISFTEDFINKFLPFMEEVTKRETNGLYEICVDDKEFKILELGVKGE